MRDFPSRMFSEENAVGFVTSRRRLLAASVGLLFADWSALMAAPAEPGVAEPSVAPNGRFKAVVKRVTEGKIQISATGHPLNESLFIINEDGIPVREFSESFRRAPGDPFPKYNVFWSEDSSHVAGVAKFPRSSGLAACLTGPDGWQSLQLPGMDPATVAREALKITGNGTYDWELTEAKWDAGTTALLVEAIVSYKTPVSKDVTISYRFSGKGARWTEAPTVQKVVVEE
jgi:hypothetical protein